MIEIPVPEGIPAEDVLAEEPRKKQNKGNTSPPWNKLPSDQESRICRGCLHPEGVELPIEAFPIRSDHGTRRGVCSACWKEGQARRRITVGRQAELTELLKVLDGERESPNLRASELGDGSQNNNKNSSEFKVLAVTAQGTILIDAQEKIYLAVEMVPNPERQTLEKL